MAARGNVQAPLPRVTIQFCTQCKWMLRAAYFAQELLSTFNTDLGEVALQPSTGGTFIVTLYNGGEASTTHDGALMNVQSHLIWDRKAEGGFPETKELKRRIRDIIDPTRDLGHVDRHAKGQQSRPEPAPEPQSQPPRQPSISTAATFSTVTPPPSQSTSNPSIIPSHANSSPSPSEVRSAAAVAAAAANLVDTPTSTPSLPASLLRSSFIMEDEKDKSGKAEQQGSEGDRKNSSNAACAPGEICEDCE